MSPSVRAASRSASAPRTPRAGLEGRDGHSARAGAPRARGRAQRDRGRRGAGPSVAGVRGAGRAGGGAAPGLGGPNRRRRGVLRGSTARALDAVTRRRQQRRGIVPGQTQAQGAVPRQGGVAAAARALPAVRRAQESDTAMEPMRKSTTRTSSTPDSGAPDLDLLALNAPAKHVLPEVLAFASHALSDASAAMSDSARDEGTRASPCSGSSLKGARRDSLAGAEPPVIAALGDASRRTARRGGVAGSLGECVANATRFHGAVNAAFAAPRSETDARCLERTVYVLDAWLERLEEEDVASPSSPRSMWRTRRSTEAAPKARGSRAGRRRVRGGESGETRAPFRASSAAEACLTASGDDDLRARARASRFSVCSSPPPGRRGDGAHVPAAMAAAAAGFDPALDYSELREYGHELFAETAEALGEAFAPYLAACLDRASATLELDDGVVYDSEDDATRRGAAATPTPPRATRATRRSRCRDQLLRVFRRGRGERRRVARWRRARTSARTRSSRSCPQTRRR